MDIRVARTVRDHFTMVPNSAIHSAALSAEAVGVLSFFLSFPSGATVRVGPVCERFRLGKDRWQRIARELRAAGYLTLGHERVEPGRLVSFYLVRDTPGPVDNSPAAGAGKPGSGAGKPGPTPPENPAPYQEKIKKGARASASPSKAPAAAAPDGASPGAFSRSGGSEDRLRSRGRLGSEGSRLRDTETNPPQPACGSEPEQSSRGEDRLRSRGRLGSEGSRLRDTETNPPQPACGSPLDDMAERRRRAEFVASLGVGLPVRDPASGEWIAASAPTLAAGGR